MHPDPGHVAGIYLADAGGLPVRSVAQIEAVAGQGLQGDRYLTGRGEWSYDVRLRNDVTLIATEELEAVVSAGGPDLRGGLSRRNLETLGLDLPALIGRHFRIGTALLYGDRPCDPCPYLDSLVGGPARAALRGGGGLRATVMASGTLAVGDAITTSIRPGPRDSASAS